MCIRDRVRGHATSSTMSPFDEAVVCSSLRYGRPAQADGRSCLLFIWVASWQQQRSKISDKRSEVCNLQYTLCFVRFRNALAKSYSIKHFARSCWFMFRVYEQRSLALALLSDRRTSTLAGMYAQCCYRRKQHKLLCVSSLYFTISPAEAASSGRDVARQRINVYYNATTRPLDVATHSFAWGCS